MSAAKQNELRHQQQYHVVTWWHVLSAQLPNKSLMAVRQAGTPREEPVWYFFYERSTRKLTEKFWLKGRRRKGAETVGQSALITHWFNRSGGDGMGGGRDSSQPPECKSYGCRRFSAKLLALRWSWESVPSEQVVFGLWFREPLFFFLSLKKKKKTLTERLIGWIQRFQMLVLNEILSFVFLWSCLFMSLFKLQNFLFC